MKKSKEQIARIKQMERYLVRTSAAVKRLSIALDKYIAVQGAIKALDEYYSSETWKNDFADDEAGLLPEDLKRGVLSEDGIWNLLSDSKDLNIRLRDTSDMLNSSK